MNKDAKLLLAFVPLLPCMLVFLLGCNKASNRHIWNLPRNERIEYYEASGDSGFTANIPQYVKWVSAKRGTNDTLVGTGSRERVITLHLSQSQTVAWITGQDAGQTKPSYLAVLDLANFTVVGGECMWQSESHSSASEIRLRHEVEQSVAAATVVEEQK